MASSVPMFTHLLITQLHEVEICTQFHPKWIHKYWQYCT